VFFVSDHCRLDDFRCSRLSRQLRPLDDRFPSRGWQSRAMGFLAGKRVVGWTSGLGWTMDLAPLPLHSHHLHASTTLEVAATQEFSTDWPSSFRGGRSALSKTLSGDEGFTVRFNPAPLSCVLLQLLADGGRMSSCPLSWFLSWTVASLLTFCDTSSSTLGVATICWIVWQLSDADSFSATRRCGLPTGACARNGNGPATWQWCKTVWIVGCTTPNVLSSLPVGGF